VVASIGHLDRKIDQKIDALDAKISPKLDALTISDMDTPRWHAGARRPRFSPSVVSGLRAAVLGRLNGIFANDRPFSADRCVAKKPRWGSRPNAGRG
jgi:hypothetical protein